MTSIPQIQNVNLSKFTTFQLGGPAKSLMTCTHPPDLIATILYLINESEKFILIGGGSNLVVSDEGVDCTVVRFVSDEPLIERTGNILTVSASTSLDDLVRFAAQNGLEGINTCSGIPGTVGGAIVGNAGAFGKQIGDVMKIVKILTRSGELISVGPEGLGFSYRHSDLKLSNDIVVEATLELKPGDKNALIKEREEILQTRRAKHPDLSKEPCAGSFFRNVEPTSSAGKRQAAGWFLDQAGGKELKSGGAYIFDKHANIIIKGDDCTSKDVFDLSQKMAALAKEKHGLDLVREVRFVGEIPGKPQDKTDVIW